MNKISDALEKIILQNPLYYETITRKIANLSQIAEMVKTDVEEQTMKPVQKSTLVVNLTRLAKRLERKDSYLALNRKYLLDYKLFLPIWEFVLVKNEKNLQAISTLKEVPNEFLSISYSQHEINVVCTPYYAREVEEHLVIKRKLTHLALVSLRFQEKLVKTPGLFYYVTALLYMHNVNIVELISTYTELNLLIDSRDIQTVSQILDSLFKSQGKS